MCINDKICIPPLPKKEKPVVIVKPKPVKKPKVFKGTKLTAWIENINELGNVTVFLNQPLSMDAFKKGSLDNNSFEFVLEKGPTSKVRLEELEFLWEFTSIAVEDGMTKMHF